MWRSLQLLIAAGILLSIPAYAQIPPEAQSNPVPNSIGNIPSPFQQIPPVPPPSPLYRDTDLLRRAGFAEAEEATVSLRIADRNGVTPGNLQLSDFTLIVNGTERVGRLHAPGSPETMIPPVVLLVFPPNEPSVHFIAVREAEKYFSQQPAELLPWRVGILDSSGELIPFTNGRSQLLADLDVVEHANEPFVWHDVWLPKAQQAIAAMQSYEGAKVLLAMNPLAESTYSQGLLLTHDGPESLAGIAQRIGAHIYIANVGGPEALVPLGAAGDATSMAGTRPSYHMQVDPEDTAALNTFAYHNSLMMQTAADTLGGFANSLDELARQIHHDLDGTYSLDFDLTPEDRDHGIPSVQVRLAVRLAQHDLHVAILDVVPIGVTSDSNREMTRDKLEELAKTAATPVFSPDFRITQHVDYFPLREGMAPVLPMTGLVEWTGPGRGPAQLSVVESVEDLTLSTMVLVREIQVHWDGRSLSWERDGRLRPGHYAWRVAVHNGSGKIFASAEEKIEVPFPRDARVEVSSLIIGKSCREDSPSASGLQRRPQPALHRRLPAGSDSPEPVRPQVDPMRAADCRLKPSSAGDFAATDTLHAFVRIYPVEKLEKHPPESWTAKFVLRSGSGSVSTEREIPFTVDSGSGYLASIEMPLDTPEIGTGPYTLDVEMRGPGIHRPLKQSRSLSIQRSAAP